MCLHEGVELGQKSHGQLFRLVGGRGLQFGVQRGKTFLAHISSLHSTRSAFSACSYSFFALMALFTSCGGVFCVFFRNMCEQTTMRPVADTSSSSASSSRATLG